MAHPNAVNVLTFDNHRLYDLIAAIDAQLATLNAQVTALTADKATLNAQITDNLAAIALL